MPGPAAARRSAGRGAGSPPKTRVEGGDEGLQVAAGPGAPRILVSALVTSPRPAVIIRAGPRAGASSSLTNRPSRNSESRSGASRKSRADREGGCRRRSGRRCRPRARRAWSWPSFSIAMYSWVPANDDRQRDVEGVLQDLPAPSPGWPAPPPPRRRSASCRASSRRATPAAASTPATGRGVLSSASMPIDCASRRAGSMVSTTTLRPRSAARSASAADVVVLPTPPEPQQTMMPVCRSSSSASTSRTRVAAGSRGRSGPTRGCERSRHALVAQVAGELVEAAQVDAAGQPGQLVGRDAQLRDRARAGRPPGPGASRGRGPRRAARPTVRPTLRRRPSQVGADRGRGRAVPCARPETSLTPQVTRADLVHHHAADGQPGLAQVARSRRPSPGPASPRAP